MMFYAKQQVKNVLQPPSWIQNPHHREIFNLIIATRLLSIVWKNYIQLFI
jgi:hypothetical protein